MVITTVTDTIGNPSSNPEGVDLRYTLRKYIYVNKNICRQDEKDSFIYILLYIYIYIYIYIYREREREREGDR